MNSSDLRAALVVLMVPASAGAQVAGAAREDRPAVVCAYLSDARPPDDETAQRWASARRHHTVACEQLASEPPNFSGALTEYERALALYEGHPERYRILGNLGRAAQALGRFDRALDYYRGFLRECPAGAADVRALVVERVAALEATLATVEIVSNVHSATVLVDGYEAGVGLARVRVPVGRHVVELRAPGHAPARQELHVAVGETASLRFTLEALGGRRAHPALFWSAAGLSLASLAGAAVTGAMALSLRADIDARLGSADEAQRFSVRESDGEHLRTLTLATDVLLGGAALFAVGAVALAFVTDLRGARARAASPGWIVAPMASETARGALVGLRF